MHVELAHSADAEQLADILFRAFAKDRLLMGICYPDTSANRQWWARMIANHCQDPNTKLFKVVDDDGRPVAWAKWLLHRSHPESGELAKEREPAQEKHGAVDPDDEPSKDMDVDACRKLATAQYDMRQRVLGDRSHWCKHFLETGLLAVTKLTRSGLNAIVTDPDYQRRGAASLLIAEGCKLADTDQLVIFSACTTQANENMSKIWAKNGFNIVDEEAVSGDLGVFAGLRRGKCAS